MDETKYHDILLKEYAEAGNFCRNCEQLTRTSLSVSLPLVSAITGVLLGPMQGSLLKIGLSLAGIAACLVFLNTIYRTRAYYLCYLARAKKIEETIIQDGKAVMSLYTSGADVALRSKTFSNKIALATILWLAFLYFSGSFFFYAYAVCHGTTL